MSWYLAGQMAVTFLVLAGAGWKAWRGRNLVSDTPRFFVRLFVPACVVGASIMAIALLDETTARGTYPIGMVMGMLVIFCAMAAFGVLIVELIAWRLRPVRTRRWLIGAPMLFAMIFVGLPAAIMVALGLGEGEPWIDWDLLEWPGIVAAAAILWWSYLPPGRPSLSRVFD